MEKELNDIVLAYAAGDIPENMKNAYELASDTIEQCPAPTHLDDPDYFQKLDAHINAKQTLYSFHQRLSDLGIFTPISRAGALTILQIANGRQIVDPIAGRGFIAKALREIGGKVLAGDICPHNTVSDVQCIDARELIQTADKDALLILAWPPRGDLDAQIGEKWKDRDILYIGELGGATGSSKFMRHFDYEIIDSNDNLLLHLHHNWLLGRYNA